MASDRPFVIYADGDPIGATPATIRVERALPARRARRPDAPARARTRPRGPGREPPRSGRSGGTTAPGRLLLRLEPDALAPMAGELDDGSRARVGHQRQDDHRRRCSPARLERAGSPVVHNRAGLEHGLGRRHRAARRGPRARPARACSRSTRPGSRAWRATCARASAALEPVPRPARPLRRARARSPTAGPSSWPSSDGRARFVLNADDPLVADLGPRLASA